MNAGRSTLVFVAPLLLAASGSIDALRAGFPDLLDGEDASSGKGCKAIRALRLEEIKSPWRGRISRISMTCKPFPGIDGERDATTLTIATLKPGSVTLSGVPVVEVRRDLSWAGRDNQFILAGRYSAIHARIAARVRAACLAKFGWTEENEGGWCAIKHDPIHGGLYIETGEIGGTWIHPDEDNRARTVYAEADSE